MRKIYLKLRPFLIGITLLLAACAGGLGDLGLLEGQWLSQSVNASGERTRLVFMGDNTFKIEAYKKTGSQILTALLDQGKVKVSGSTITFIFDEFNELKSTVQFVTDNHIMIDESTFFRANPDGSFWGGTISGQVRIDDGSEGTGGEAGTTSALQGMSIASAWGAESQVAEKARPKSEVDQKEVRKFFVREKATLHFKKKGERRFSKQKYTARQELKDAVKAAETVPERLQALQTMQKDLTDEVERAHKDCQSDPEIDPTSCYISAPNLNRMRIQSATDPNDPSFYRQWGMRSVNAPGGWAILDKLATHQPIVAIIDTGIAFNPDLPTAIFESGYDFISATDDAMDGDGRDNDPTDEGDMPSTGQHTWHGTHVSGIIAAENNNAELIASVTGVSPKTKLMHLRAMGLGGNGDLPDIADAVLYAAGQIDENGTDTSGGVPRAEIINLSLGCFVYDENYTGTVPATSGESPVPWCESLDILENSGIIPAIRAAIDEGVIVVAAAGNCNDNYDACSQPFYPASQDGVLKVGGITSHGVFATFLSNEGHNQFIVAPSGSLEPSDENNPYLGSETQVFSTVKNAGSGRVGTSQASPFVAGAVAAMLSIKDDLTPSEIETILKTKALDLGPSGYDDKYGNGLLNIGAALEQVALDAGKDLAAEGVPAAKLLVSQTDLNYGEVKNSKTVFLHKVGYGDLTDLEATKTADWVNLDLSATSAPATLKIEVDRSGLSSGSYTTTVSVASSNGSADIEVSMSVPQTTSSGDGDGTTGDGGTGDGSDTFDDWLEDIDTAFGGTGYQNTQDIGEMIILLIKADDNSVYAGIRTNFAANYRFSFGAVPDGQYYVLAGKQNNQGLVCDIINTPEVPCTAFPSYNDPQIITIQGANTVDNVLLGL